MLTKKFRTLFTNKFGTVHTKVFECDKTNPNYNFFPAIIYGIRVETDGFEVLSVENPESYTKDQLENFEYDIKHPYKDKTKPLFILKNFSLQTYIPVSVFSKKDNNRIKKEICIEISNDNGHYK